MKPSFNQRTLRHAAIAALIALGTPPSAGARQEPEPIPADAEILLIGSAGLDGSELAGRSARMAMGRTDKSGPLALGAVIQAGAVQSVRFELLSRDGREILRRTVNVSRAGSDDVLMRASIDMDAATLLPLEARVERGGAETVTEYDWERFVVRTAGAPDSEIPLDLPMLEVGAHDVWIAALPLREGFVGRLPALFGSTGIKYWAVPRVVGSEPIDLGTGEPLDAWVVELDWWGMGASNTVENRSRGGGVNGTAGPGGKYWVLKDPPAGVPPVVRVRTEVDADTDSVIQVQAGG